MALEPINVVTHSREIEQEYLKVVRGNDPDTTWLIISPNEKKEYAPQYVGSGFSEFLNSFEDVKVQYGLARVSPPGSDVEKLVLVGWCPDSAPMKTRASFAANFGTVANQVLKGYHIQITARDQDDLDENQLLERVSNAAGARYSIQSTGANVSSSAPKTTGSSRLATPSPAPAAAASAPPAAPPKLSSEPAPTTKQPSGGDDEDDWGEPEVKERDLEKEPVKTNQSSYKPIGKVDLQKIIAEENSREDPRLVNQVPVEGKKAPDASNIGSTNTGSSVSKPDTKPKSAESVTGGGVLGTKPPINFGASQSRDDDKVIKGFKNEKSPAQIWAEKKAAQANESQPSEEPVSIPGPPPTAPTTSSAEEPTNTEDEKEPEVKDLKSRFEKLSSNNEPPIIQPKAPINNTPSGGSGPEVEGPSSSNDKKQFGTPLPGMHKEDDNEDNNEDEGSDNDEWEENEEPASSAPALPSRNTVPPLSSTSESTTTQAQGSEPKPPQEKENADKNDSKEQETSAPPPPLPTRTYEQETPAPPLPSRGSSQPEPQSQTEEQPPTLPSRNKATPQEEQVEPAPPLPARQVEKESANSDQNPYAIAEYDYEAAEDNELTFREHDRIVNIEFVDEDWWLGELEGSGEKGLFPSNYVSLQH